MRIHHKVVEIFSSGLKWWTNSPRASNVADNKKMKYMNHDFSCSPGDFLPLDFAGV